MVLTKLSVNVNKVALLRNTRHLEIPSVLQAARTALDAGAAGVTVHPRPDQRHIRPDDVTTISRLLAEPDRAGAEFNIEGNPFQGDYLALVAAVKPDQCTLVPDDPSAFTSDHGWDIATNVSRLRDVVARLHDIPARVSLFMDPDPDQIRRVPDTGAERIELYTESYASAFGTARQTEVFNGYARAASVAEEAGLGVNAGHDLNLLNLGLFVTMGNILEVSIGHALIADALDMGLGQAVRAYLEVLRCNSGPGAGQPALS